MCRTPDMCASASLLVGLYGLLSFSLPHHFPSSVLDQHITHHVKQIHLSLHKLIPNIESLFGLYSCKRGAYVLIPVDTYILYNAVPPHILP